MSDFHAAMSLAIHQLYEALLDPAAFQPAIEAMSHAMGGRRVMLLNWNGVVSNAPDLVSTFAANGPSFDSFFEQYNSHYHPDDPAKHSWPAIAENDWLQYDGDQPSSDWSHSAFYQDFARGQQVHGWAVLKVAENRMNQQHWALTFIRDTGTAALDQQRLNAFAHQYGPHLRRSLLLRTQLTDLRVLVDAGLTALNACSLPLWLLEGRGAKIRFANEAALAHLRSPARLLQDRGGQLWLGPGAGRMASVQQRWQALMASDPSLIPRQADGLRLPTPEGGVAVLQCFPMPPAVTALAMWQRPIRMVVLHPDGFSPPDSGMRILKTVYGFTSAECRVAGLLLQDLTIAEIAERCKVQVGTVRYQVKSLLQKTSCRRQTELVSLLFRLHIFGVS